MSFLVAPENYIINNNLEKIFKLFNVLNKEEVLRFTAGLFILAVIISGFFRILYIKLSNKLSENITSDFRIKIFNFLLSRNYKYYFNFGSQEILSNLSQKTRNFSILTFCAINIFNGLLISVSIIAVLIFNEPIFTPIIILFVVLFYFFIFKIKSSSVLKKGKTIGLNQNKFINIFENAVGYLPEIILYNLKNFFSINLAKTSKETAIISSEIRTTSMLPRVYLEIFIISFIIFFILFSDLISERQNEANLAFLAILAFGAQKTLPLINAIYNWSINFKGATPVVISYLNILESNFEKDKSKNENINDTNLKISFDRNIIVKNLSYQYEKNLPKIINNLSFEISVGKKVAVRGKTGSGKTTLINIIAGLLELTEGKILVDGINIDYSNLKSWQKNIAFVPQTIFLNDSSILENIAIGQEVEKIDFNRAKKVAKIAQIEKEIENLPNKYFEKVGERGVKLSGGQKQRIGIARALYRDAKLIILDEPTSGLDKETENLFMNSITNLGNKITVIMISHSNNFIKYFDQVIDLEKNN